MIPHHAEANLEALIESTEDLIWSVDLNCGLLTFNGAFHDNIQRNFGVRPAMGMRSEDMLPPERAALWPPLYELALSEGPFRAEYSLVDGRTLELALNPIVQDGETTGISVFGKDITERKTAEAALREAEEKYRDIFEGALEGIFRTSLEGQPLAVNSAFAKMLGYESPQEFTSTVTDAARQLWRDPNERSRVFQLLEQQGVVRGDECHLKRKDGTSIWASFNSRKVCGKDGRTLYYEGFIEDITGRRRIEDALRNSERRYRDMFEGALEGIYRTSLEGKLLAANPAAARMLGYDSARELVSAIDDTAQQVWLDPNGRSRVLQLLEEHGVVRAYECQYKRKDGTAIWVSLNCRNVFGEDGRALYNEGFIEDITERKRIEDALRKSEEEYRDIFEGALEGIHRTTFEGAIVVANPALARMLGYDSAQEVVSTITDSAHQLWLDPNERPRFLRLLEQRRAVRGYECQWKRKDGTAIWASLNCRIVFGKDGRALYTEGFIEDITERKRIEDALRKSEKQFATAFRGSPAAMLLAKIESEGNRIVDANEAFERLSGYRREEVIGRLAQQELRLWADPREYDEYLKQFRGGGRTRDFESHFRRKSGEIGTGLISAESMELDGQPWMITTTIDITEQKKTQERYRLISENAADVIWMWDLEEARCVYVSPSVEQLRGFTPEEILAQPADQAMPGDTYRMIAAETERRRAAVESGDEGPRIQTNEVVYLRKDGTTVATETATKLVSDARGKVRYIVGASRDITELKRAEAEKARIEDQLRQAQKLESVGRLAAGVAHDFNNLLTVINGYSRLLLGSLKAGDPLRDGLEEIHKAGERAAGLTQQLLAFSRKQILQPRVLNLNCVVEEMRPMLERLMGENVEVCVKLDAEATTIRADPNQLEQVVMNLAVNSRDAMPRGGKLSIETGFVKWGESHIRSRPGAHAGCYVVLAVSDTGEGMSEETRGHIFEPFFTTKEVGKGTGLGLSTIHGIVEQSGGYVEAASELGRGTTFKIYMPRVVDAQADLEKPEAKAAMGGKETVLVVEDQAVVRRYAAAALGAYGYRVIEAENAEEALLVCEREGERIDLILTDVVMPGLSGGELADRLKKLRPGIKVLFMSGYAGDTTVHQGVLENVAEFIQKPFGPDELAVKVREMLMAPDRAAGLVDHRWPRQQRC